MKKFENFEIRCFEIRPILNFSSCLFITSYGPWTIGLICLRPCLDMYHGDNNDTVSQGCREN